MIPRCQSWRQASVYPALFLLWCRAAADLTSSVVSALSLEFPASSATARRLHNVHDAASALFNTPGKLRRQLQGSLVDEANTVAWITASASSDSSMVVYEVASASATSRAVTVATLTFGQAQLLLGDATALQDDILAIAAVAVCGNGVCELGERPNSTAAAVNATGSTVVQYVMVYMVHNVFLPHTSWERQPSKVSVHVFLLQHFVLLQCHTYSYNGVACPVPCSSPSSQPL